MTILTESSVMTEQARARRESSDDSPEELPVYITRPREEAESRPALVLLQEAFGVNDHIRDLCRRYARQGYVVVSPDIYYRAGHWITFRYDDQHTAKTRLQLIDELTEERVAGDLKATFDCVASLPEVDPDRVGVLGYCLGGRLAYMAAYLWPELFKAVAVYYGGGIVPNTEDPSVGPVARTGEIEAPLVGFFGGLDSHIPQGDVELISHCLEKANVEHELHWYPYADHGFFCDERPAYNPRAAQDAWHRTLEWFGQALGPVPRPNSFLEPSNE